MCTLGLSELRRMTEGIIDKAANKSNLGTRTMSGFETSEALRSAPLSSDDGAGAKLNSTSDPTRFSGMSDDQTYSSAPKVGAAMAHTARPDRRAGAWAELDQDRTPRWTGYLERYASDLRTGATIRQVGMWTAGGICGHLLALAADYNPGVRSIKRWYTLGTPDVLA